MNFFDYKATKVWFTDDEIFIELDDMRQASLPLHKFPLLQKASQEQKTNFEIISGGYAVYWQELDEDLSVAGFFENKQSASRALEKINGE